MSPPAWSPPGSNRTGPIDVLVHELDLSHALLGWSSTLRNGKGLTDKFGDRVGYHYSEREDVGLFWSNDPKMSIGEMVKSIDAEEIVQQVTRNRAVVPPGGPDD